jgi:transposase
MQFVAGVDCHADSHTIVFINAVGEVQLELTIDTTAEGYTKALDVASRYGNVFWGLEGTGSYGRAFADFLVERGAVVYEVPGSFTKRHRKHASQRGKSDAYDARAIAEAVLREADRLPRYEHIDEQEAVRLQYDRRDRLVRERTQAVNRLRSTALRLSLGPLPVTLISEKGLRRIESLSVGLRGRNHTTNVLVDDVEDAIADIRRFNERIANAEKWLRPFVERLCPELLTMRGISVVVAAGLLGHAGNLKTCRNAGAFAMRAGTAPVSCSSGRSQAVRLNVGGDRQLNRCLHVAALSQLREKTHAGRIYYDRKRTEGKTHRAALRALKRQLTTVVHYRLQVTRDRLGSAQGELHVA